ncbi:MAG: pyruvate formate lyase-activating protein [Enterocloster asparagiformis]|nr:pyruvate formate lyase-activating protein [Enterocloster asparagiformis]
MIGRVHSIESFGTVDGPGIRMVIFLSGCPMRCLYCHNPDTWDPKGGTPMTVDQLLGQYENARHFYRKGGITVSGGEPLMQIGFVTELFEAAKKRGIHTCLDTSGITFRPDSGGVREKFDRLAEVTDLVLLDIKHIDPQEHVRLCGQPQENILAFARYLEQKRIPVWIRHVVVPGITDSETYLYRLGQYLGTLKNIKALDVLPYHDMGKAKYKSLGITYPLEGTEPLPPDRAAAARQVILRGMRDSRNCS